MFLVFSSGAVVGSEKAAGVGSEQPLESQHLKC